MICEGVDPSTSPGQVRPLSLWPNGALFVAQAPASVGEQTGLTAAPSATTVSQVLDLGLGFAYTLLAGQKSGAASTGETLSLECSSDGLTHWLPAPAGVGNALATLAAAGALLAVSGRPICRYVRLVHTNGLAAQTDMLLRLAAWSA